MAKQTGILKLNGTIGGITFYGGGETNLARKKSSLDKKRVETDPAFAGSRRAYTAVGKGATAYSVLKHALHPYLVQSADARQAGRSSARMAKVVREDKVSKRGEEIIRNENLHLLKGFEGNKNAALEGVIGFKVSAGINRSKGEVKIEMPAHDASVGVNAPEGATHYQICMVAATVDFEKKKSLKDSKETAWLELGKKAVGGQQVILKPAMEAVLPVVVGIGIRFAALEHGQEYRMHNKAFNAFQITEIFV